MINTLSKEAIAALDLKKADEVLVERQTELGKIFEEAKSDDGRYDFNQVKSLTGVKGSVAVAEYVAQVNAELDAVGEARDVLISAEKAATQHASRSKARRDFMLPGGGSAEGKGNYASEGDRFKSLGDLVAESKSFKDWSGRGAPDGITISLDDMLPSDMLSQAGYSTTIGQKALFSLTAGYASRAERLPGFVEAVSRPIQLLDLLPMIQTSKDSVPYMEETTRIHGAAGAAEGAAYAESTFAFTERNTPVRKITDSIPVTDEQLDDEPMMVGYLNGRLIFGIRQKFDSLALVGDGLGTNLRGLKNVVGVQVQAKGADPVPDALFKAMMKVRTAGRSIPTNQILHPTDWQNVRLLRTVDGVYIWGNPSEAGPERIWGLGVSLNDADVAGTAYTGCFQSDCVTGVERKGVDIQVGFVGNQFGEGKRTIRGDCRVALVWRRPAAFCQITGL
jgi:HK97 family phage major capsid protein